MKYRIILALLTVLDSTGAFAEEQASASETILPQQLSAEDLLYTCNASALTGLGRERRRYCAGFISGVEETARLLLDGNDHATGQAVCMPAAISSRRLADVYTRYAMKHEGELEKPAAEVALQALGSAFPCPAPTAH